MTEVPNTGHCGQMSADPMSELNPDAMDQERSGVSYPPYMADAKSETPNERSAGLKYRERNEEKNAYRCVEYRRYKKKNGCPNLIWTE